MIEVTNIEFFHNYYVHKIFFQIFWNIQFDILKLSQWKNVRLSIEKMSITKKILMLLQRNFLLVEEVERTIQS